MSDSNDTARPNQQLFVAYHVPSLSDCQKIRDATLRACDDAQSSHLSYDPSLQECSWTLLSRARPAYPTTPNDADST